MAGYFVCSGVSGCDSMEAAIGKIYLSSACIDGSRCCYVHLYLCKRELFLCINKLSNLSEKYLQECYDNEIILSESINSFTHELENIKKEYPDIFF